MAEYNQGPNNPGWSGDNRRRRQDEGQFSNAGNDGGFQDKWMRHEEDYPDRGEYPHNPGLQGGSQQQFGNQGQRRQTGGQGYSDDSQRFRHQEHNRMNPGDSTGQPGAHFNDHPQGQKMGYGGSAQEQDYRRQGERGYGNQSSERSGQQFYEQGGQQYGNAGYGGSQQHRRDEHYGNHMQQQGSQDWNRQHDSRQQYGGQPSGQSGFGNAGYSQHPGGFGMQQPGYGQAPGGHRGRGPRDYRRSEDRIREDVCDRLTDDDWLDASHVNVLVQGNEVILSGTVNSREEKRRAEDVVESISGVTHVENRIRVQPMSDGRGGSGYDRHIAQHQYTGVAGGPGSVGDESGTTNEIIRNAGTPNNAGLDPNNTGNARTRKRADKGGRKESGS